MSGKNPAATFYWNDWENDPELKACSLAAQGLWMRCLCIAARSPEPGVVLVKGQPSGRQDLPGTLARLVGQPPETLAQLLDELIATETASVDRKGRVVCRRMLRAAGISLKMAINGGKGAAVTNRKKKEKEDLPQQNERQTGGKDAGKAPGKQVGPSILQDSESSSTPPPSPQPASGGPDWARWGVAIKAAMAEFWPNDQRVEMAQTGVCATWVADGLDLELDALPTVRSICADMAGKRQPAPGGLKYFDGPIRRRHAERLAGIPAPQPRGGNDRGSSPPPDEPWEHRVANHRRQLDAGKPLRETSWHYDVLKWGPMPGEPGCRAPAEILVKHGPWPKKEAA